MSTDNNDPDLKVIWAIYCENRSRGLGITDPKLTIVHFMREILAKMERANGTEDVPYWASIGRKALALYEQGQRQLAERENRA